MKSLLLALLATATLAFAQAPKPNAAESIPADVAARIGPVTAMYSKVDLKRPNLRAPAENAWTLRAPASGVGTVEVGVQGNQVVYLLYRRGTGGNSIKLAEISALYEAYIKAGMITREHYTGALLNQINAAYIIRKDFDPRLFVSGN